MTDKHPLDAEDNTPRRKVLGATAGSPIGFALATLVINATEYVTGVDFAFETEFAATAVVIAAATYLGGWLPRSEES